MNETTPVKSEDPALVSPLDHADVLNVYALNGPDAHPDLRAHMDRLSNEQPVSRPPHPVGAVALSGEVVQNPIATLDDLAERLLGAPYDSVDGRAVKKWWSASRNELRQTLQQGEYSLADLQTFLSSVQGYELLGADGEQRQSVAAIALPFVPVETLRAAYHQKTEDGQPGVVRQVLHAEASRPDVLPNTARSLGRVYGITTALGLKDELGSHQQDPVVQHMLSHPKFHETVLNVDLVTGEQFSSVANRGDVAEIRDWTDRYMAAFSKLPESGRNDFLFASNARTMTEPKLDKKGRMLEWPTVDAQKLKTALTDVLANTADFDTPTLDELHRKAGITNFDYYSASQLSRMKQFLDGDPELIKHLQEGDVTVVFTDANADHNAAFRTVASENGLYEKPSGRTLFFEVSKRNDLNRYRALLKRHNVQASTVVLNAHGSPDAKAGGLHFGAFRLGKRPEDPDSKNLAIDGNQALTQAVGDMMQDSKGVDDPTDRAGRRNIILNSCSQGKDTGWRLGKWIRRAVGGRHIYQADSTAVSLAKAINDPRLDIHAVNQKFGFARSREESLYIQAYSGTKPIDSLKVNINEQGRVHETTQGTIRLDRSRPSNQHNDSQKAA